MESSALFFPVVCNFFVTPSIKKIKFYSIFRQRQIVFNRNGIASTFLIWQFPFYFYPVTGWLVFLLFFFLFFLKRVHTVPAVCKCSLFSTSSPALITCWLGTWTFNPTTREAERGKPDLHYWFWGSQGYIMRCYLKTTTNKQNKSSEIEMKWTKFIPRDQICGLEKFLEKKDFHWLKRIAGKLGKLSICCDMPFLFPRLHFLLILLWLTLLWSEQSCFPPNKLNALFWDQNKYF